MFEPHPEKRHNPLRRRISGAKVQHFFELCKKKMHFSAILTKKVQLEIFFPLFLVSG